MAEHLVAVLTDLQQEYGLTLEDRVLQYAPTPIPNANARISLSKTTLDDVQLGNTTLDQAMSTNDVSIDGQQESFNEFIGMLDTFPFWFNIVTP